MRVAGADVSQVGGLGEDPVSSVGEPRAYLARLVAGAAKRPLPALNVTVQANPSCGE